MKRKIAALAACIGGLSVSAEAAVFMDADWAAQACKAWNANATLTTELGGDRWAANDAGRGFKTIQMYREACGPDSKVEISITNQDGKAICSRGGAVENKTPNYKVDYLMHATDEHWACMGKGGFGCGAMGAMMSGKLKFSGPKGEAMGVMGPFNGFLKLTGEVPGDMESCP
ncbi:sterol-binding protein [Thiohalocapsa marina]|uniref:Sterol-binding protein n=1 Tax=Thiohalocapsa marina TaxID=424902 RepID=A0A5M8FJG8_9GAMM|nr:SCP2 sterol-binding domain-containing protein [Thiohalocapsa marina]KAA6183866.1 sterol-binding protein [Thiohalocapsa marina]